jgi:hypothetical protein
MKQLNQTKLTTKKILLIAGILVAGFQGQAQKVGDNLGNHIATQALDMQSHNIVSASGVVIGAASFTNTSVSLELAGTTQAFLVNRVATLGTIAAPVDGMMIYSNADNRFYFRNNSIWETFASSTNTLTSVTAAIVGAAPNVNGLSLSTTAGVVTINLQPADAANPGVVTTLPQTFGGNKIFSGAVNIGGSLTVPGVLATASSSTTDQVLVIDASGIVKTSTLTAGVIMKVPVGVPVGTNLKFTSPNMYISFDITVGVIKDDGVVVNFAQADALAFAGLTIKNVVASANNTVTIQLEDDRNPVGYVAPNIDSKSLIVTWLHKN